MHRTTAVSRADGNALSQTLSPMENQTTQENTAAVSVGSDALVLPLELAFIRWSVVHRRWHEMANDMPLLQAFLAGWCCRCIGTTPPGTVGTFRESFFAGWREADDQVTIASRQNAKGDSQSPDQKS